MDEWQELRANMRAGVSAAAMSAAVGVFRVIAEPKAVLAWGKFKNAEALAQFCRDNPTAPPEALFRWSAARDYHDWDAGDFETLHVSDRAALSVFHNTVTLLDGIVDDEVTRRQAKANAEAATASGPLLASAHGVDVRDTIMELQPDPLETNPGMALRTIDDGPAENPEGNDSDDGGGRPGSEGLPAPSANTTADPGAAAGANDRGGTETTADAPDESKTEETAAEQVGDEKTVDLPEASAAAAAAAADAEAAANEAADQEAGKAEDEGAQDKGADTAAS